jgi:hypothetical protein
MSKHVVAAVLAAFVVTAMPLPAAQAQTPAAQDTKQEAAKPKKGKMSAALSAMRDRQKKCGAEWKEAKAAGKIEKGQTWPKYWSACNKRLKGKS